MTGQKGVKGPKHKTVNVLCMYVSVGVRGRKGVAAQIERDDTRVFSLRSLCT